MEDKISKIVGICAIASFCVQAIIGLMTGGYTIAGELKSVRGEIELLRKDMQLQNKVFELRLTLLENNIKNSKNKP